MTDATFAPAWFSRPGDTLRTMMKKRGITVALLAEAAGWPQSKVLAIVSGTLAIDDLIANKISEHVGGSREFWIRRQANFVRDLSHVSALIDKSEVAPWLKQLPVKQMRDDGWIETGSTQQDTLRATLAFFDVASPEEWRERYTSFANEFRFRTSPTYSSTIGALSAWLRRGELLAEGQHKRAWNPGAFREALIEMRQLTRSKNPASFIPKLRELASQTGVAVVFVKAPPGCRTSGASRFISQDRAMMILSFRYLSDDHFWFSFFHEAGHLLLHGRDKTFVDGDLAAVTNEEDEANAFSAGVLVPQDRLDEMLRLRARADDIIRFARSVGVSPGIVVGQMQHHRMLGPQQMAGLKRRYTWQQVADAAAA